MRVYRFNPALRPDYNPRPAVMPRLPNCAVCDVCLGEDANPRAKYCVDCRRLVETARRKSRKRKGRCGASGVR